MWTLKQRKPPFVLWNYRYGDATNSSCRWPFLQPTKRTRSKNRGEEASRSNPMSLFEHLD